MANEIGGATGGVGVNEPLWQPGLPPPGPRPPRIEPASNLDPLEALLAFGNEPPPPGAPIGLADQLLAWLAPRPANPDTLSQSRIAPLLGLAAEMLAQAATNGSGTMQADIARLGAAALEQELRLQSALADRRATLLRS